MRSLWQIGVAALVAMTVVGIGLLLWNVTMPSSPPVIHTLNPAFAQTGQSDGSTSTGLAFLDKPRPLPDVQFVDAAGHHRSLADFRGHPLVLNIWATWCVPCRKEMPTLDRLQAALAGSDAVVLPLSIDSKGLPVVESFYKEIGMKSLGIYVNQSGDATHLLGAVGIPTTLLVDRDGREIARKIGPAEWDSPDMLALIRDHLKPRAADARSDHGK